MRALETATGAFSPFEWAEEELLIGARASVVRATYTRTHLKPARRVSILKCVLLGEEF